MARHDDTEYYMSVCAERERKIVYGQNNEREVMSCNK